MIKPTELMSTLKAGSFTPEQSAALAEAIGLAVKQGTEDMLTTKDLDTRIAEIDAKLTKSEMNVTKAIVDQTRWIIGFACVSVIIILSAAKFL